MFKEFRKKVVQFKSVGIFSHIRPDGDCVGSQVALALWLEKNGVRALAFNDNDVPQNLKWLSEYHPVEIPNSELTAQCDAFVVVDGNTPARFGSYEEYQQNFPRPVFMIDHHPDPENSFDLAVSVESASSTCELIYQLFMEHEPGQLDEKVAKALYTGIITDTGSFQYDSVTPETLEAAANLLRCGKFRPNDVIDKVVSNKSLQQLQLLGLALDSIRLYENNQIAIMYVNREMLSKTNTNSDDCDGFVNYALSISGIQAAILLKDLDGKGVKMSLRSRNDVDVNKWARELGGGGHKKAAGAWHPGPLNSAISDVVKIGVKQLKSLENENVFP